MLEGVTLVRQWEYESPLKTPSLNFVASAKSMVECPPVSRNKRQKTTTKKDLIYNYLCLGEMFYPVLVLPAGGKLNRAQI